MPIEELKLIGLDDYEQYVGAGAIARIKEKAYPLQGRHVTNINSTFYGGGVAEILSSLTLLMNDAGIETGWRVIQGAPDFFNITKKMHNALQSGEINLTELKKNIYEHVNLENSVRNHLSHHDIVIVHDPQPLPMILHYPNRKGSWIWRCHIDLSNPNQELWSYLSPIVEKYDAVIVSIKEYKQKLKTPQKLFLPAINPFSIKNRLRSEEENDERLARYNIPTDLPIVTQISRFDKWKDPGGVIQAYKLARKEVDCTLVLLGNIATDDPEGVECYESLLSMKEERIIILSCDDSALVNALQSCATVVVQKSIREGFGLTVTEAMWKGTPVIGGNVGGIKYQIENGKNGFLVNNVEEAAERIVQVVKDQKLRERLGQAAKKTVSEKFLMTRLLEQYLDLFNSFETINRLKH